MSDLQAHHYVPRFYLKGFADPSNSSPKKRRIWVYQKGKGPRLSTPEHEAHQKDYYGFEDASGSKRSAEELFSHVESTVAPVFRRVDAPTFYFSDDEKSAMAFFVAGMFCRGPSNRDFIDAMSGRVAKAMMQEEALDSTRFMKEYERFRTKREGAISAAELRTAILDGQYDVEQKSRGFNLQIMVEMMLILEGILLYRNWVLLHASGDMNFVTSDNPVFTLIPEEGGKAAIGSGFGVPGVEVYFPLTAQTCLMITEDPPPGSAVISDRMVDQINGITIFCAKRFLYAPHKSTELAERFERDGCQISYGVNALMMRDSDLQARIRSNAMNRSQGPSKGG